MFKLVKILWYLRCIIVLIRNNLLPFNGQQPILLSATIESRAAKRLL